MEPKVEQAFKDFLATLWDARMTKYCYMDSCRECAEWPDCDAKEKFCVDAVMGLLRDEPWTPRYR